MTTERFNFAWNNLVASDPRAFEKGSEKRAAAIAAYYMGLANNGGINSFLTCSHYLDGSEVLESLVAVGALTAAKEFGHVLRGLGGTLPVASQKERFYALEVLWHKSLNEHDVLSTQADKDIIRALERHVMQHEAFYYERAMVTRTAQEVATYLRNFINGEGGEWDWDDFESVPITDPDLERIRREAAQAGPPDPDLVKLAELLRQAEARAKA